MTEMTWTEDGPTEVAQGAAGSWRISPYDVARLSYTPSLPGTSGIDGGDKATTAAYAAAFQEWQSHPGKERRTEAYQRLGHHFGAGMLDPMFGETVEEAMMLAATMEAGDDGLASVDEQLADAGFAIKWPEQERLAGLWSRRIKSGSYDVTVKDEPGHRSIYVRFHGDGAKYWHNVASVCTEQTGRSGDVIYHAMPTSAKNPLRVAVAHAIRVMEARIARGGRFSTPLGERLRT